MLSVLHDGPKADPELQATIMGVTEGVKQTGGIYFGSKDSGEDDVDEVEEDPPDSKKRLLVRTSPISAGLRPCELSLSGIRTFRSKRPADMPT